MRYIADTVDFELKEPTVVTLGKFDGRHRGHQKLLRTMEEVKESLGYATAIFTFSTAPLTLVTGETATVITTSEERRHNMEKMGIDYLVEYPFTDDVRKMDPAVFVKDIKGCGSGAGLQLWLQRRRKCRASQDFKQGTGFSSLCDRKRKGSQKRYQQYLYQGRTFQGKCGKSK